MTRKLPLNLIAVLALGFVSQVGQVLFLRELLMVFQGSELSIGLILAAWLAWVGVGSYVGAYLVSRFQHILSLLAISASGVVVTLPVTLLIMRGLRGFFNLLPGAQLSLAEMTLSCFLLVAPACLLIGIQFVLLSRVWRELDQTQDTSGAGKTYVVEAAGNVMGGFAFTFLMVHQLNSFQSAILAVVVMPAAILLMAGKGIVRYVQLKHMWLRLGLLGLIAATVVAMPTLKWLDDWAYQMQWRNFMPQHQLVETRQSKHGAIAVLQREDQFTFYQSGHLVFSVAGPGTVSPGFEEQEAVEFAHFAMVQHLQPNRVLLIGGGLRGVLGEMVKHPVERIDYIELDQALVSTAQAYISPETREALADERVRLIHTDGRLFVKASQETYDLIVVDVPDPATAVLNRYYTQEFFLEANSRLKPDGVFVIGATSTPDLRGTAVANRNSTLYHTLKTVFSEVLPAGERFLFYFAANMPSQISVDPSLLQERYLARDIQTDGFSSDHFQTLLQESQLRQVNWVVRNHGRSPDSHLQGPARPPLNIASIAEQELAEAHLPPVEATFVNSDFKPIGYYYTLMYLDDLTRVGNGESLKSLLHVQFWWALPLFGLPLLVVSGLRVANRRRARQSDTYFAVLLSVFTTGFSTMSLQIALLFSFQSIYGFVYEIVGLIVATFMLGLSLGALFSHRYVINKTNLNTLAGIQVLIALIAVLLAFGLPGAAGVRSPVVVFGLFSMLTFFAGLVNGVDFPLSTACCLAVNKQAEKSAGNVYGMELLGACVGAALTSVVIAPILGIVAGCMVAALANFSAFVALMISRRS